MRLPQLPTYYNYLVSITQQIAQQCKPNNFIQGSLPGTNPRHILPEAYIQAYIRNCNWYTIYNPDYSQFLTHSEKGIHYQHANITKQGLTEMGNRLQGHYYGYTRPEKTCQISFQTKINLSSAIGGRLVLRPRWSSRAILPLIYHCIITHDARA